MARMKKIKAISQQNDMDFSTLLGCTASTLGECSITFFISC